jgi:hypothetical protein
VIQVLLKAAQVYGDAAKVEKFAGARSVLLWWR